jgi:hypothetical protein
MESQGPTDETDATYLTCEDAFGTQTSQAESLPSLHRLAARTMMQRVWLYLLELQPELS